MFHTTEEQQYIFYERKEFNVFSDRVSKRLRKTSTLLSLSVNWALIQIWVLVCFRYQIYTMQQYSFKKWWESSKCRTWTAFMLSNYQGTDTAVLSWQSRSMLFILLTAHTRLHAVEEAWLAVWQMSSDQEHEHRLIETVPDILTLTVSLATY